SILGYFTARSTRNLILAGLTVELVATLILALYMAYDPNSLVKGILRLVPRRHHQRSKRILKACETRLRG
ncbi:MAG: hypothetical protein V7L31_32505, partial [Nostoc sp.]